MMRWIVETSLKLRLVVATLAALLMVFGFMRLRKTPVDALPEFSRPHVEIQIEALGLSAPEVEALITTPLEADMLNGTPWAKEIRSVSIPGLASVVLVFEKGTEIMRARQMVQERVTTVFALPKVSKQFTMINPLSSTARVMEIGLTSSKLSLIEMSVLARWTIQPRLLGVPGVANVSIWGRRERQLQVQVDPERLRAENVTLQQIIKTAGNSLWASPLSFLEASTPGTGGWVETPNQRLGIRHLSPIRTAADLAKVPVEDSPSKRLGDVVTVVEDHQPLIGDAIVKDAPALMLVVEKFPWANTREVTEEIEKALAAMRPGLSGVDLDSSLFRPATFIELALANLVRSLLIGGILVAGALLAFLFNWRTALISTAAILVSVLAAWGVLYARGVTINLMILAGLVIALAAIIDDAIADAENIARRRREHQHQGGDRSVGRIFLEASLEMRTPLLYATAIMVLAVVPTFFLEGVSGAFVQPLAAAYILALVASMVTALTVTPALSLILLRNAPPVEKSPALSWVRRRFDGILSRTLPAARAVCVIALAIAVTVVGVLPLLRQESLLPKFKETDLLVRWEGGTSASHQAMSRVTALVSRELRSIPGVRNVSAGMGRAIMSDKWTNINSGEVWVSVDPQADYGATLAAVKKVVAGYPGLSSEVLTYLQVKAREELSGTGESLVVGVYGSDLKVLREKADEVQKALSRIAGVSESKVQYPEEMLTVEIEVNLDKAKRHGLKPGEIRRAASALVSGIEVGNLFDEQKVFDVIVWGTPETRHSVSSVQELLIDTPGRGHVRLKEVADVRIVSAATAIHRHGAARRMDVTAAVHRRDLAAVAGDVEREIKAIGFPLEYRAELLGEYAERLAAQRRVLTFAIAAAILILLIVQAFFRSWRLAMVVLAAAPMALVGGMLAAFLTGGLLSLGSMIGFLALSGIAVRNAFTLIGRYRYLEQHEGEKFGAELIRRGTQERLPPILISALTTGLALVPFVLFGDIAGLEILRPMALVLLSGLVTTTVFTLVVAPAVYLLFGAVHEPVFQAFSVGTLAEEEMRGAIAKS
jgi:CzcA family heavy metal efflux pump